MAAKFTMDAAETEAGLSTADAAVAQRSGSRLKTVRRVGLRLALVGRPDWRRYINLAAVTGVFPAVAGVKLPMTDEELPKRTNMSSRRSASRD